MGDANGNTPAHYAALAGHKGCLRALHELGAGAIPSASMANGGTPAHCAANGGHEGCLRALHELGAGASLSATNAEGFTPAHLAAQRGREGCLRALHELEAGASLSMAKGAILALKDRTGSSRQAIKKFIESNYKVDFQK